MCRTAQCCSKCHRAAPPALETAAASAASAAASAASAAAASAAPAAAEDEEGYSGRDAGWPFDQRPPGYKPSDEYIKRICEGGGGTSENPFVLNSPAAPGNTKEKVVQDGVSNDEAKGAKEEKAGEEEAEVEKTGEEEAEVEETGEAVAEEEETGEEQAVEGGTAEEQAEEEETGEEEAVEGGTGEEEAEEEETGEEDAEEEEEDWLALQLELQSYIRKEKFQLGQDVE